MSTHRLLHYNSRFRLTRSYRALQRRRQRPQRKSLSMRQVSLHSVLTVALESAEKHEASPSVLKRSRFRTKIDMGSVSAAERDMLELFHVESHQHSDLR